MTNPTQYRLIRSPYQHRTWDDCLMRNLFRLQGIRNAEAARNIGQMRIGDLALYYNNIGEKALYGILEISVAPYPDPTANEAKWVAVDAIPTTTFDPPIGLENLKQLPELQDCPRLSVAKLTQTHFETILSPK